VVVDVDFNILTAFIRLDRAGPVGAGCPPYYYLTLLHDDTSSTAGTATPRGEQSNALS